MQNGKTEFTSSFEKGANLEIKIADIYSQLGSSIVKTNLRIAGQQLDVYAELPSADGFYTKVGIDCKNYESRIGVNEINKSAQKLALLRQSGAIDIPLIVSTSGFTAEASSAASALGVKTTTLKELSNKIADFTIYLKRSISKYESTEFFKKDLYCRLNCTNESGQDNGYIDDYTRKWFEDDGNFLTILGDYGTGKTIFAERLFWELAKAYLNDPVNNRIPVYIPLKKYRKEINIRSLITDLLLHEYLVKIKDYSVFKSLNEQGRLVIILDAFDEMAAGAEESEVISNFREIKSLLCEKTQIILTCRTHFFKDQNQIHKMHEGTPLYQEVDNQKYEFKLCFLSPFTKNDVVDLVYKYDVENAEQYIKTIENTYNLSELSRHPILLDMILRTVPDALTKSELITPADLYTTYTGFWLERDDWRTKMTHDQREFFMKELAFYFQLNGITEMHFSGLPKYIRQKFPGLKTFKELDYFEADVRTCTFLTRDPVGNYSFVHRSFCEYFTSLRAFEYFKVLKWPVRYWRGRYLPTNWITNETARFTIDLIRKNNTLGKLLSYLYTSKLDGTFVLNILTLFKYSTFKAHQELFDIIFWEFKQGHLQGLDYRREIESLATTFHSDRWESIEFKRKEYLKAIKR